MIKMITKYMKRPKCPSCMENKEIDYSIGLVRYTNNPNHTEYLTFFFTCKVCGFKQFYTPDKTKISNTKRCVDCNHRDFYDIESKAFFCSKLRMYCKDTVCFKNKEIKKKIDNDKSILKRY